MSALSARTGSAESERKTQSHNSTVESELEKKSGWMAVQATSAFLIRHMFWFLLIHSRSTDEKRIASKTTKRAIVTRASISPLIHRNQSQVELPAVLLLCTQAQTKSRGVVLHCYPHVQSVVLCERKLLP